MNLWYNENGHHESTECFHLGFIKKCSLCVLDTSLRIHTHVHAPFLLFLNLTVQLQLYLTARGMCKSLIRFFKSLWPWGLDGVVTNRKITAASYSILKHKVYTRTAWRHKSTGAEAYNGRDTGHWRKEWGLNLHRLCSVSLAMPLYSRHGLVGMSF